MIKDVIMRDMFHQNGRLWPRADDPPARRTFLYAVARRRSPLAISSIDAAAIAWRRMFVLSARLCYL
jgi:hypothetical protein